MKQITLLLLTLLPTSLLAQEWEFGVFGGASVYGGDLTEEFIATEEVNPGVGGIIRYNFNKYVTLKSNIYYGTISGDDANAESKWRIERNLSFKSDILDLSVQAEINFSGFWTTEARSRTSIYGLIGASVFRFNPQTKYNGRWVDLQPLGTEGQGTTRFNDREKYALTQISIPIGLGVKHAFNKHWSLGFEVAPRKTFTDYLDDVSKTYVAPELLRAEHGPISDQLSNRTGEVLNERKDLDSDDGRGNSTLDDWYYFAGVTVTYTIVPDNCYSF